VLCLLASLVLFACNSKDSKTNITAGRGSAAPDFALQDLSGKTLRLSSYKQRVILLEFWATWCPPCRDSIPELISLQERYKAQGFTVIAVSVDTGDVDLTEFVRSNAITYPVVLGSEEVTRLYDVNSVPVSFLIDKEGRIIHTYMGFTDTMKDEIASQIEKII
jgi:peroxiredoxin